MLAFDSGADLLICNLEDESFLAAELRALFPQLPHRRVVPGLFATPDLCAVLPAAPPRLAFLRQWMPQARLTSSASIKAWADVLSSTLVSEVPEDQPWRLHIEAWYGLANAGGNRCDLIRKTLAEVMKKRRRHLWRRLVDSTLPFQSDETLVQLLLISPDEGFVSVSKEPQPKMNPQWLSPFPLGLIPVAVDKAAPSRAFAKVLEAQQRLGLEIQPGERCVDLGASPGSWSYVALRQGARVTAIDRSPLREDLMTNPNLDFVQGDAFAYEPPRPVDWLLCDVIAAPDRSMDLALDWVRRGWARRFVVTIKFKGREEYDRLQRLKQEMSELCPHYRLTRLCANKNEVCVFGSTETAPSLVHQ